jgi:hypothetical protein
VAGNWGKPRFTVSSKTAAVLLTLATGGEPTLSTLAHHTRLPVYPSTRLPVYPSTRLPVSTVYRPLHDLSATVRLGVLENGKIAYVEQRSRT